MFCPKCGAAVSGGEALCPLCGASLTPVDDDLPEEEASPFAQLLGADEAGAPPAPDIPDAPDVPAAPNVPTPPDGSGPEPGLSPAPPKKKHTGLIVGLCVAAVLVVAAFFAVPAILQAVSPAARVAAALGRTMDAVSAPLRDLGLGTVFAAAAQDPTATEISFSFDDMGTGRQDVNLHLEHDPKGRKLATTLGLSLNGRYLVTLDTHLEDDLFSFSCPALLGEDWYSMHTRTLGADFNSSALCTGNNALPEEYGLDFFAGSESALTEATETALAALWKEYGPAVTLERTAKDVSVSDSWALRSDVYTLTFPADALRDYSREALYVLLEDDATRPIVLWLLSTALDDYYYYSQIGILWEENSDEVYDGVDALVDRMRGDLVLNFFLSDKLVRRITGSFTCADAYGEERALSFGVVFGNEKSLTDELRLTLHVLDGGDVASSFELYSQGHHAPVDGVYDDETRFFLQEDGSTSELFCSSRYDSNASADNFSFSATPHGDASAEYTAAGTVLLDPKAKTFMASLSHKYLARYQSSAEFATYFALQPLDGFSVTPTAPTPFFSMTEEGYTDLQMTLLNNIISVLKQLYSPSATIK